VAPNSPLGQGRGFCFSGSLHWSCLSLSCSLVPWQWDACGGSHTSPRWHPLRLARECPPGSCFPEPPTAPARSHGPSEHDRILGGRGSPLELEHPGPRPETLEPTHPGLRASTGPGTRRRALRVIVTTKLEPEGTFSTAVSPRDAPAGRHRCVTWARARPAGEGATRLDPACHAQVGDLIPSSQKKLRNQEALAGGELRLPRGPRRPRLGRKCRHTHCRNPGAGPGAQETGPEVPQHMLEQPGPPAPTLLWVCGPGLSDLPPSPSRNSEARVLGTRGWGHFPRAHQQLLPIKGDEWGVTSSPGRPRETCG